MHTYSVHTNRIKPVQAVAMHGSMLQLGATTHKCVPSTVYIVAVLYNMYSGYVHMHMYTHHTNNNILQGYMYQEKVNWELGY